MPIIETLRVIHIGAERTVLLVSEYPGTENAVVMPFRAIAADVLRLGSKALLLSHNHPSGDPAPSLADLIVTRRLAAMLQALDVRLHDHIIRGADRSVSFRGLGLL